MRHGGAQKEELTKMPIAPSHFTASAPLLGGYGNPVPHQSEIRIATSRKPSGTEAIREVAAALGDSDEFEFLLIFVSPSFDPGEIVSGLALYLPGIRYAGCSTAGEISPDGLTHSSVVLLAFPQRLFSIVCAPLYDCRNFDLEQGTQMAAALRRELASRTENREGKPFAMTLLDGLCRSEEPILSALQFGLDNIPLVGGSSGDNLALRDTFVLYDGHVLRETGLLLLIHSELPFQVFQSNHFEPTSRKMVVTACDPKARVVTELDASPAGETFAQAIGMEEKKLDSMCFATHPLLVHIGNEYFCRSIQSLNPDGSLSFYCAIDNGVVLTVAHTKDMVQTLEETLAKLETELGPIDCIIGFDCTHRRLEAANRLIDQQISDVFKRYRVAGFSTYGEQYNALHLNYTFSAVAFGHMSTP
jgi:hypothetical protein